MIGQQSVTVMMYIISLIPLLYIFSGPVHWIVRAMIIVSIIFSIFAICWINYLVSYNRLGPLINKIKPESQIVWLRVTKDGLFVPQIAEKGPYGQTKSVCYGKKADVINKGDFPIRTLCGNNAIIVWDKISHNVNGEHAIAWKKIFKKYKVNDGKEAYAKAAKVNPTHEKAKKVADKL